MEKELKDLFEDDFLEPLSAFCESLESNDIDTLLNKFEAGDDLCDFIMDEDFSLFDNISPLIETEFSSSSHQYTSNAHQERRRSSSNSINTIKVTDNKVDCSSRCGNWKVVKQETKVICSSTRNDVKKVKKKKVTGISLLAKPPKNKVKKQLNGTRICPNRFAAYFYQHHDYCSNPNKIVVNNSTEATVSSP